MSALKKILIPIDFTKKSIPAVQLAKVIAKHTNSKIILVHVLRAALNVYLDDLGNYKTKTPSAQNFLDDIIHLNQKRMDRFIEHVKENGVEIDGQFRVHNEPEHIANIITKELFDLTIVGGFEHKRFDEFLRTTHPEKIASAANNPVITINEPFTKERVNSIIVPTDLKENYSSKMKALQTFAELFQAEIKFAYINTPAYFKSTIEVEKAKRMWADLHNISPEMITVFNSIHVKKGILEAADFFESDMIGLVSRHQGKLKHLLNGSITEWLINRSDIPVITYNLLK